MKATDSPVIVSQLFDQSIPEVWHAITQLDAMQQWFFDCIPDFKAGIGFKTQFTITNEGRHFTHLWHIIDVIPLQKITYHWSYIEYPGSGHVIFELNEQDEQTLLTLTNTTLEDFPQDLPEFKRESAIGGWNYFIKQQLPAFLSLQK